MSEYDFTYVTITACGPGLKDPQNNFVIISWAAKDIGFGEMTIVQNKDGGPAAIDSECMGKDFCKALLMKLVDEAELRE